MYIKKSILIFISSLIIILSYLFINLYGVVKYREGVIITLDNSQGIRKEICKDYKPITKLAKYAKEKK